MELSLSFNYIFELFLKAIFRWIKTNYLCII